MRYFSSITRRKFIQVTTVAAAEVNGVLHKREKSVAIFYSGGRADGGHDLRAHNSY
jgi:hypothetical protein